MNNPTYNDKTGSYGVGFSPDGSTVYVNTKEKYGSTELRWYTANELSLGNIGALTADFTMTITAGSSAPTATPTAVPTAAPTATPTTLPQPFQPQHPQPRR